MILPEINHLPRCLDAREEWPAGDVDARVVRLRGKYDRDQQLVGIGEFELGRRRRVRLGQPPKEFEYLIACHLRSSSPCLRRSSASANSFEARPKPTRK